LSSASADDAIQAIARIHTDFPTKFGIPRQSGLVDSLIARIVFEPEYRNPDALRGLSGFSHIWLIWKFSETRQVRWSPMVRPPRLGGDRKMGVFATRSPFRPNALGLSSVRLARVELDGESGPVLHVRGADLLDGSPIYDIKPYLPYTDSHPEARAGFADSHAYRNLAVDFPRELREGLTREQQAALVGILENDPRPHYHDDPERVYGFEFGRFNIRFTVACGLLVVREVRRVEA
jgi:tRNA-Thr(GGU) m(6)t(6)A37 methyltransferase TsaA